jgi:hypothetical protein
MRRATLTLIVFTGLTAWVSAQSPNPGPTAAEQLQLFRKNQSLLGDLLDGGLRLAKAGNEVDRAAECQKTARRLVAELKQTTSDPTADPDRVAELADHLTTLVTDGLAPTLAVARSRTTPASPDYQALKQVHADARADLEAAQNAIPPDGRIGLSTQAQAARGQLTAAAGRLGTMD